jgi:4-diphosphocytidyl-2C-methyl-D-erythritol kinase
MITRGVIVRVPAKINLQLAVGPLGADGFHEVTTVFQAISLFDDVTIKFLLFLAQLQMGFQQTMRILQCAPQS